MHSPKPQKRKHVYSSGQSATHNGYHLNTHKPSAVYRPSGGRSYTVSVAIPGSIVANAPSHRTKTNLAGQIGRALAVFCVDEVVIFDDGQSHSSHGWQDNHSRTRSNHGLPDGGNHHVNRHESSSGYDGDKDPDQFLYHLLSFLEVPPYLRNALFPLHANLRTAGQLPSLAMPHHSAGDERCPYVEGVTLPQSDGTTANSGSGPTQIQPYAPDENALAPPKEVKKRKKGSKPAANGQSADPEPPTTLVNTGLADPVQVSGSIPPNTRVTLKVTYPPSSSSPTLPPFSAVPVDPSEPRTKAGYYWGYTTRRANSISSVFTECPFADGYDLSFGMSERGVPLEEVLGEAGSQADPSQAKIPPFRHLLIALGGLAGLEVAIAADKELESRGVTEARELFDYWVNICPSQGSKTIRTEEALWLALMGLRNVIPRNGKLTETP